MTAAHEPPPPPPTHALSHEDEERLVERLYTRAVAQRAATVAALDARYYPTVPPRAISREALQRSVARQHDEETQRRAQRRAEAAATPRTRLQTQTQQQQQPRRVLHASELDDSVERLYTQSLQRRHANLDESRRRAHDAEDAARPHVTVSRTQLQTSVQRLSVPKKTTYTIDEVNAIYGLS